MIENEDINPCEEYGEDSMECQKYLLGLETDRLYDMWKEDMAHMLWKEQ